MLKNYTQHRAALRKAFNIIGKLKPDIIHIHNLMDPEALHMLRKCGPVVKSMHDCRPFCVKPGPAVASRLIGDSEIFCNISFGWSCWKHCYAHSGETPMQRLEAWSHFYPNLRALHEIMQMDQLIVYSQYLKDLALLQMSDPQRIHVVHHFTEAEFESKDFSSKPSGTPVFLFAGRLDPEKGILKIFDALALISDVACKLVIAGDGPIKEAVIQRMKTCHPMHEIEMRGFVGQKELYELYRQSSVLLFPSFGSEACGLSGIEAMYYSTPAIGYDSGGVGEWLINNETGILLPRGDIAGLAQAMAELATNPEQTARLGRQARTFVSSKFCMEKHIRQIMAVYEQALQMGKRS